MNYTQMHIGSDIHILFSDLYTELILLLIKKEKHGVPYRTYVLTVLVFKCEVQSDIVLLVID